MRIQLITAPSLEPISLAEIKLHCKIDSGSFADNIDETQSNLSDAYATTTAYDHLGAGVDVLGFTPVVTLAAGYNAAGATLDVKIQEADANTETLTLDVAPATDWAADDIITGQTSAKTCVVVAKVSALVYTVKDRSGTYTLDETIGVTGTAAKLANQGAANPVFSGSDYTDWTGGGFTQVTDSTDPSTQEIAYTGTKQYIRTVAKVLVDVCTFGTQVIRLTATSVEDDDLMEMIKSARLDVENDSRRQLITATWDYFLDRWPSSNRIKLPFGNLQTVTHIKYRKSDWSSTADDVTLTEGTDYIVETNGDQCGFIVLPYGVTWPSFTAYPSKPIGIRFICGYGDAASDVPANAKRAIKLNCGDQYMNRESQSVGQAQIYFENLTYRRLINNIPRLWDEF